MEPHDKSFNDNVESVEDSYVAVVEEDSEDPSTVHTSSMTFSTNRALRRLSSLPIIHGMEHTSTGKITSAMSHLLQQGLGHRSAGFDLREVMPLQLEAACRVRCTRGAPLKEIHDMGTRRYLLSVDNDNEFRSRCE